MTLNKNNSPRKSHLDSRLERVQREVKACDYCGGVVTFNDTPYARRVLNDNVVVTKCHKCGKINQSK